MKLFPSPFVSRGLAILILFAIVGVLYVAVAQPVLDDYRSTQQSIEDMNSAIERYRRVTAELAQRRATLATLRQRQAATAGFLQGTNDSLVAAQIQNRLKTIVEGAHGELKSSQVLPAQEEGRYRRVTIRGQMVLHLTAAQKVFYAIESASPLLFLDNLNIRTAAAERRRDRGASATANQDTTLDVRFDVYGYIRSTKTAQERPSVASSAEAKGPTNAR